MNNSVIFGGILAAALLALYILSIVTAVNLSLQPHPDPGDAVAVAKAAADAAAFDGGGYSYILNLIGALISASVVSTLAITDPQDLPGARALSLKDWKAYIPSLFIVVWILCGLAAVYFGMLHHETEVSALTAQGKAWLGAAVASVYAYIGVTNPNAGQHENTP